MGNCHFKTDFDAENITGKYINSDTNWYQTLSMNFISYVKNAIHGVWDFEKDLVTISSLTELIVAKAQI